MATKPSPSRKSGKVIHFLETLIRTRKCLPGDRLPAEEELSRRFGVSRVVVRDAFQALKARGLVVSRRGSGSYVSEDAREESLRDSVELYSALNRDADSFLELLDLRLLLETFCIRRLAAPEAAPARERLRKKLHTMEAQCGNLARFGAADIAFHMAIVEEAGSKLMTGIMRGLLPQLGVHFATLTYTGPSLAEKNLADHLAIFSALENGDADDAERKLRKHLTDSRQHLESMLASS